MHSIDRINYNRRCSNDHLAAKTAVYGDRGQGLSGQPKLVKGTNGKHPLGAGARPRHGRASQAECVLLDGVRDVEPVTDCIRQYIGPCQVNS